MIDIKFHYGREEEDDEKAVLPALVYVQKSDDGVTVHNLAFGWWDYFVPEKDNIVVPFIWAGCMIKKQKKNKEDNRYKTMTGGGS